MSQGLPLLRHSLLVAAAQLALVQRGVLPRLHGGEGVAEHAVDNVLEN